VALPVDILTGLRGGGRSSAAGAAVIDAVHTESMPRGRTWRWLVPGVALLACVGVWLGHTLEYVRVWGWSGLDRELTGSTHLYMVPLGLGLTLLLAFAAGGLAKLHRRLARRVQGASALLTRAWRDRTVAAGRPATRDRGAAPSWRRVTLALGAALAVLQVGLYLIQENVETAVVGVPAPGASAVSGVHWAAPLIQLAVGFALAAVTVTLWWLLRRREAVVERIERAVDGLLAALAARRFRAVLPPSVPVGHHGAPALLGASIWCRPPPAG
jgi:hypothetical protein